MTKVTKVTTPSSIVDLEKYVDYETGELLISSIPGDTTLRCTKDTGMRIMTSDNYSVIEVDALMTLSEILNNSDLAQVMKMSITTKTPLNIVFNNTIPHTNDTLQQYLKVDSKSNFLKLIKRLITAGVLYQIKGKIYGEVRVCYMLNPYLSRRRKQFEEKVFQVFSKFE